MMRPLVVAGIVLSMCVPTGAAFAAPAGDAFAKYGLGIAKNDPCFPQDILDLAKQASQAPPAELPAYRQRILAAIQAARLNCQQGLVPLPPLTTGPRDSTIKRTLFFAIEGEGVVWRSAEITREGFEKPGARRFRAIPESDFDDYLRVQVDRAHRHGEVLNSDHYFPGGSTRYKDWARAASDGDIPGEPGVVLWRRATGSIWVVLRQENPVRAETQPEDLFVDGDTATSELRAGLRHPLVYMIAEDPRLKLLTVSGNRWITGTQRAGFAVAMNVGGVDRLVFGSWRAKDHTHDFLDLGGPVGRPGSWSTYVARVRNAGQLPPELEAVLRFWLDNEQTVRIAAVDSRSSPSNSGSPFESIGRRLDPIASDPERDLAVSLVSRSGKLLRVSPSQDAKGFELKGVDDISLEGASAAAAHPLALLALKDPEAAVVARADSANRLLIRSKMGLWRWSIMEGAVTETLIVPADARFLLTNEPVTEFVRDLASVAFDDAAVFPGTWLDWPQRPTLLDYMPSARSGSRLLFSRTSQFDSNGDLAAIHVGSSEDPGTGPTASLHVVEPSGSVLETARKRYPLWRAEVSGLLDEDRTLALWMGPERAGFVHNRGGRSVVEPWVLRGGSGHPLRPEPKSERSRAFDVVELYSRVQPEVLKFGFESPGRHANFFRALVAKQPEKFGYRSDIAGYLDLRSAR